ncbi:MAG: rod shape-determining protein MreC [Candidatus Kapaibacterium sp.]
MRQFVKFVEKYKEYITFTALVVISLSLISMGSVSKIGGFRTFVIGSMGWLQEIFAWIPNPGALQSENRALRELNLKYSAEVTKMRRSLIENEKLRDMLDLRDRSEHRLISSEISGRTTIEMRNYITLNKGEESGIRPGMPVRTDAGLVGTVLGATDNYAIVELLTNRNVRVSAKVQRNNIPGIMVWEGGENFIFKNVPESFDVEKGDEIITSNYSNKYPAEIPIGEIASVGDDPGSLFLRIEVRPFVNFSTLQQVFVIDTLPDPERQDLIRRMEDRLRAQKSKN